MNWFYRVRSGYGEPEYCPYCGKRSVKRIDTDEEAGEENN
jgi:hypothetical protein